MFDVVSYFLLVLVDGIMEVPFYFSFFLFHFPHLLVV